MRQRGEPVTAGTAIPHVYVLGETKVAHPSELASQRLHIDYQYYLGQQILPVIERLCEFVEGVSSKDIALALGLDVKKYEVVSTGGTFGNAPMKRAKPNATLSDSERFKAVQEIPLKCGECDTQFSVRKICKDSQVCISCPKCKYLDARSFVEQLKSHVASLQVTFANPQTICRCCHKPNNEPLLKQCIYCEGELVPVYANELFYEHLCGYIFFLNFQDEFSDLKVDTSGSKENLFILSPTDLQKRKLKKTLENLDKELAPARDHLQELKRKCDYGWIRFKEILWNAERISRYNQIVREGLKGQLEFTYKSQK